MNTIAVAPEVAAFLDAVRTHLADVDPDEQREILDGLEADLGELVAEQGPDALGDPGAYAAELRQAAGLVATPPNSRRSVRASVAAFLDACHDRFDATLQRVPVDVHPVLEWARPLWWIARAWLAVQLLDFVFGNSAAHYSLVPHLGGLGWVLLLLGTAGSVAVGLGRIWPGGKRGLFARLVLLGLNGLALVSIVTVADQSSSDSRYWSGYSQGYTEAQAAATGDTSTLHQAGIYSNGRWVSNIYPYDASGKPLVGVQLFDQNGEPVDVRTATECVYENGSPVDAGRQYFPWSDGAAQKRNVFPVPSKVTAADAPDPDPSAFAGTDKPQVSGFPFAKVPEVSLPGLLTSTARTPAKAFVPGPRTEPINPIDNGC